jgi:hypothetical protein
LLVVHRQAPWAVGANGVEANPRLASELTERKFDLVTTCGPDAATSFSLRWVLAAGTPNMNDTQRWLAWVRPRHNPAENALIANMRDDPNIPCLNSLAAMRHYARQRWPHDPAVRSLIPGVWQRYRRWQYDNSEGH